jgi:CubicO group peptidase (beta-lactamase class C family)
MAAIVAGTPGGAQGRGEDAGIAKADSALRALERQGLSAVVLIAKNGSVALAKGYGLANRAQRTPMSPSTVVQIGSNTKDFTAVAILQLSDAGRLRLTDSLGRFFDDVPADKRGITVRHLLNHRAGFPLAIGRDWDVVTREEFLKRAMATPLLFTPGDSMSYSNPGYSLLAAIIEKVSGTSYDEYVASHIAQPAGLRETGYLLPRFDVARLAHGYRNGEDMGTFLERPHATDGVYWNLRGNGGMLSTVGDMLKFYHALFDTDVLLAPATRNTRFDPRESRVLAGSDGVSFFLYNREPQSGLEVIVATNSTDMQGPRVRGAIAAAIGSGEGEGGGSSIVIDGPKGAPPRAIELPDSPSGRAAAAYFRHFNSGDAAGMRAFIRDSIAKNPEDTRTLDERVAGYTTLHDARGALTPVAVIASSPAQLTLQVRSAKGGMFRMIFDTETSAPYRLIGVRIEL